MNTKKAVVGLFTFIILATGSPVFAAPISISSQNNPIVAFLQELAKIVKDHKKDPKPKPVPKPKGGKGSTITLEDIGWLQLAAHDLFNTNRTTEVDTENGALDLSTIFDQGDNLIATGGDPRNSSNIIVLTVTMDLVDGFNSRVAAGESTAQARAEVVTHFHQVVDASFQHAFGEKFPAAKTGATTKTEDLALRTVHDFLPGTIKVGGKTVSIIDPSLAGKRMTFKELQAKSSPLDGQFDQVFIDIGLLAADSSFATQFSTEHTFEEFLGELTNGKYDKNDVVMTYIRSIFGKGRGN